MNAKQLLFFLLCTVVSIGPVLGQAFQDRSLLYDGEVREYVIYVPDSYDGGIAYPLLFNFHGGAGDIASQIATSDMRSIADTAGFILIYPQALPDPNDDGSTNWLHKEPTTVDDVFFIEALIDSLSLEYEIDPNRIYACGYSLGGEFSYELACRLNDRIAAIGVVARTMNTGATFHCAPTHPTGVLTILGTQDWISPYEGLFWGGEQFYLSADEVHDYWATHNNTAAEPTIVSVPNLSTGDGSTVERHIWSNGDGCVNVEHLKIIGGGHDWPGTFGNMDVDASLEIWNYVSQYDLDGLMACNVTSNSEAIEDRRPVSVYPNPVLDYLTIDSGLQPSESYRIFSTDGKILLAGKIELSAQKIGLSVLPAGAYVLKVGDALFQFVKLN